MDRATACFDFALLGHQENWELAAELLDSFRGERRAALSHDALRASFAQIPPRPVVELNFRSQATGRVVRGIYIETFIAPDELQTRDFRRNLQKIRLAAQVAHHQGARIAGLGGFTSIVCQGQTQHLAQKLATVFTTGNTLTSAYIVKGIERAINERGKSLSDCTVLILGSTGDIGSACARYFAPSARQLILVARNRPRLERQARELRALGANPLVADNLSSVLAQADAVICVASMHEPMLSVADCREDVVICDAGFPRNVREEDLESFQGRVFLGGRGNVLGGMEVYPDLRGKVRIYPLPTIVHGCMLEAVLLAMEDRWEPYSHGRGAITVPRMEEMWRLAEKHGFALAPFFNQLGLWKAACAS